MKRPVLFFLSLLFFVPTLFAEPLGSTAEPKPPLLTQTLVGDSNCKIKWEGVVGVRGYNVYLKNENGSYAKLNGEPVTDLNVKIGDLVNGNPYYFGVTSLSYDGVESAVTVTNMVVPAGYSHAVIHIKGGTSASDYSLITIPFVPDRDRPEDVFAYLESYDTTAWRFFELNKNGYSEYGQIKKIKPGKGYWFISRTDRDLFVSGRSTNIYKPAKLILHPGWNLVGSPFLFPVKWDDVINYNASADKFIGNAVWEFEGGGFKKSDKLEPFKGYYVYSGFMDDIDLLIPPKPLSPALVDESGTAKRSSGLESEAGEWLMKIAVSDSIYSDKDNLFGVTSKEGFENIVSSVEPPAWSQHLSLFFERDDEGGSKRSSDVRKQGGEWLFYVEGGESDIVTVRWQKLKGEVSAKLLDVASGHQVDMSKKSTYTYRRDNLSARKFLVKTASLVVPEKPL